MKTAATILAVLAVAGCSHLSENDSTISDGKNYLRVKRGHR